MRRPTPRHLVRTYQDGNIYGLIIPYQHLWSGPLDLSVYTTRQHRWHPVFQWHPVVMLDAVTGRVEMRALASDSVPRTVRGLPADDDEWSEGVSILRITPPYSLMLKWAKGIINKMHRGVIKPLAPRTWNTDESEPLVGTIRITAPKQLTKTIKHVGRTWTVTYRPLSPADTKMHSMSSILELCKAALVAGYGDWDWPRFDLNLNVLSFNDNTRVMGKAVVNTDGSVDPPDAPRIISLSRRLLQGYDQGAILRTILHEICHLAREELYPRVRSRFHESHDKVFAEMMIRADPSLAQNPEQIEAFFEDVDPHSVAAQRQAAAKSKKVSSKGRFEVYRTKPGYIKLAWVPDRGRKIVQPLTAHGVDEIMSKLEAPPVGSTPVTLAFNDLVMLRSRFWPFAVDKVTWLEYLDAVFVKKQR